MRTIVETVEIINVIDSGVQGPPGKDAASGALIDDVTAAPDKVFSSQKIMEMLYPFSLSSFSVSPSIAEMGNTISALAFSWATNYPPDSVSMDNNIGAIALPATSYSLTGASFTSAKTFTLTAVRNGITKTAQASLAFLNRVYWGEYGTQTLDPEALKGMGSQLSGSRVRSVTFNCSGGKFFHLAYPKRLGQATFKINNLSYSDVTLTEVDIANQYGFTETYYVYYCNVIQYGSSITLVVS